MDTKKFDFYLPPDRIAQSPLSERAACRLLQMPRVGELIDGQFPDIKYLLRSGDVLVFNNTQVLRARLYGRKATTGGRIEILFERNVEVDTFVGQIKASKAPRVGTSIVTDGGVVIDVEGKDGTFYKLRVSGGQPIRVVLQAEGHLPLPPYINRRASSLDDVHYQTVFSTSPGAVAAPTAGLHFDESMMSELESAGVTIAMITLHVGAGTFQPVRDSDLTAHRMHSEWYSVPQSVTESIEGARRVGGRVIAVGTTVVRALESAVSGEQLIPFEGYTDLFIYPGYAFRVVDCLITNFHLPRSTLLMMVSAFAGSERVMAAYRHAVDADYRFFSYGDAMWLDKAAA